MNTPETREDHLVLELLDVVGKKSDVSQRHLARHLGVALGLANSYLKRCIRKGLIKISSAPANRYLYYVTPKGFAEKSRLTAKYLSISFEFYRQAGESCQRIFECCRSSGWRSVTLCGVSDLAEIAMLRALEHDVQIIGLFDPLSTRDQFLGKPVWRDSQEISPCDAFVVTDVPGPKAMIDRISALADSDRILVPDIFRLG